MFDEQTFMGVAVAVLCGLGLWHSPWLAAQTPKGKRLGAWLGTDRALLVIRLLCSLGVAFGVLLALRIVNPLRW